MRLRGYPPMTLSLYVVPVICEPLTGQPIGSCVKQNPHLVGLDLADGSSSESRLPVDLLVGSDYYWDLVTGSICRGTKGPTAVHTKLGWVLSGPALLIERAHCSVNLATTHVLRVDATEEESYGIDDQLRSFWELESLGIRDQERTLLDGFMTTVMFEGGRYQVSLPWKEYCSTLPNNYQLSVSRLKGLLHRLRQNPTILKAYDKTIKDQLEQGIVEPVPVEEETNNHTHYLPHHAVVRQHKFTTKLRIVYDASARSNGNPSLNDCLQKGPKFNQLVLDLLLRFRAYQIALIADVEKAFLMISVDENDRDVLRFIWVEDISKEPPVLREFWFTRVVFGVSSSPFLINATIRHHLEQFLESDRLLVQRLLQSAYVDDIITGGSSEDEVFHLYKQAKEMFRKGGFNRGRNNF